ncbi:hypothetical protein HMPREF1548_00443 [Clostridium sp. KLE 1755]|nr:hypothetical protein HMPREF1548_00443 [Clostridium sp. KLE 1755]
MILIIFSCNYCNACNPGTYHIKLLSGYIKRIWARGLLSGKRHGAAGHKAEAEPAAHMEGTDK